MKKLVFALTMILGQFGSFAQDDNANSHYAKQDNDIQTVFRQPKDHHQVGFYIGPEGAWTKFDQKNVYLAGLSFGVIVDHVFSVGLSGYGILNSSELYYPDVNSWDSAGSYLYGGYGGFKFEFKAFPTFPVHISFPLLIGGGGLVYDTWNYRYDEYHYDSYDGYTVDWDAFFVVEPGIRMEVNLVSFMRVDAGVSYRYTPDLDLLNTSSSLINNFNLAFSLKFGKF